MADLESVLADVSYLMAMEKSKAPGAKTVKKFSLPDPSVHCVVHLYLEKHGLYRFKTIQSQRMGAYFLEAFMPEPCEIYSFYRTIQGYKRLASLQIRQHKAKEIYDRYIYGDILAMSRVFPKEMTDRISDKLKAGDARLNLFDEVADLLCIQLEDMYMKGFSKSPQYVRFCQWKYMELSTPEQLALGDFSIHRIIGRGGFGEVYGCRKDDTGRMFAMKLLDKKRIKLKKGEALALNERNMLARVNSPFVVNLYYAFQTPDKLCFILDLMNGGDLHYHLTQHGVFSEEEVRFYAAELILALEHIHAKHIVYRDLKPSNILLDEQGHIRLSDLGLACDFRDHQPSSSVGTHGYMAPEVIKKGVQYTFTADWFSLGCVLYKLLRGHSPFRSQHAKNKEEIDEQTLVKEVTMPTAFSPELRELLTGLLQKDTGKRLACLGAGADEVKVMAFFKDTNWDGVLDRKLSPPLIPPRGEVNAADAFDIGNFDDDDTKGIKVQDDDQRLYRRFNLLVSDSWQAEMLEGIFESVNTEKTKQQTKEQQRGRKTSVPATYDADIQSNDIVLQGYGSKIGSTAGLFSKWEKKYFILYPNRLEWADNLSQMVKAQVLAFDGPVLITEKENKSVKSVSVQQVGNKKDHLIRFDAKFEQDLWHEQLRLCVHKSQTIMESGPKKLKDYTSSAALLPSSRTAGRRPLGQTTSVPMLSSHKE